MKIIFLMALFSVIAAASRRNDDAKSAEPAA
jgi:hypothetical protein